MHLSSVNFRSVWVKKGYQYALIPIPNTSNIRTPSFQTVCIGMVLLSSFFSFGFAGFLAGQHSARLQTNSSTEIDTVTNNFRYSRIFAEIPSNQTDEAWKHLFPPHGGFFTHPAAPHQRSTLSVFHQLHCLDGIRQGYWAVYQSAIKGQTLDPEELPMMISPPHIRHCIDYIRQSLMCSMDTTIERKENGSSGVKGFGTEHKCSDWEQLILWISNIQAADKTE